MEGILFMEYKYKSEYDHMVSSQNPALMWLQILAVTKSVIAKNLYLMVARQQKNSGRE
jgi:hypothetical protein